METQFIRLNMIPSGVIPIFNISQYDVRRMLGVYVYAGIRNVNLDNYTVTVEATRSDGTAIIVGVTTNNNVGTFEVTPVMSNFANSYRAQLVITDGNSRRIASLPFIINVIRAAMNENSEAIEEDASLYQQFTDAMQGAIAETKTDIVNEATARTQADNTLQLHINAEITARQNADNTLQANINNEAYQRAQEDTALNSRIDNLIVPSGSAPSAAEIIDARTGASGKVYDTLGDAIRSQIDDLENQELVNNTYARASLEGFESATFTEFYVKREYGNLTCGTKRFDAVNVRSISASVVNGYSVSISYWKGATEYNVSWAANSNSLDNVHEAEKWGVRFKKTDGTALTKDDVNTIINSMQVTVYYYNSLKNQISKEVPISVLLERGYMYTTKPSEVVAKTTNADRTATTTLVDLSDYIGSILRIKVLSTTDNLATSEYSSKFGFADEDGTCVASWFTGAYNWQSNVAYQYADVPIILDKFFFSTSEPINKLAFSIIESDFYEKENNSIPFASAEQLLGTSYQKGITEKPRFCRSETDKAYSISYNAKSVSKVTVKAVSGYLFAIQGNLKTNLSSGWQEEPTAYLDGKTYYMFGIYAKRSDSGNISQSDIDALNENCEIVVEYQNCVVTSCAFVSTEGSDITGIGTPTKPYATVNHALEQGANRILISGGVYSDRIDFARAKGKSIEICNYTPTERAIFKQPNMIMATSAEYESGYTKVKKIAWETAFASSKDWLIQENAPYGEIADSERHPSERGRAYRCDSTPIVKCQSSTLTNALNEIENSDVYKWYFDTENNVIYFSSPSEVSESNPITQVGNKGLFVNGDRSISLKVVGIEAEQYYFNLNNIGSAEIVDCKASLTNASGAFTYDNGIDIRLVRCEACLNTYGGTGDGFNGHSVLTGDPFAKKVTCELIDCWSHDNRDDGYSDHECSETVIRGGLYEYNGKGGVTPSYGSHCSCFDVYSRNNYSGFYYIGNVDEQEGGKYGQMICYNCIAEKNDTGGSRAGFKVAGTHNSIILVGCKSIDNPYHYISSEETNIITLIDCGAVGEGTIKSGDGTFVVKNTTIVNQ